MTKTTRILEQLRCYESRNVTFLDPAGDWPMVWERAKGVHVWDVDNKKYIDFIKTLFSELQNKKEAVIEETFLVSAKQRLDTFIGYLDFSIKKENFREDYYKEFEELLNDIL